MAATAPKPSSFDRFIQLTTTLLLTAIVVLLALCLVEFKRMTHGDKGLVVRGSTDNAPLIVAMPPYVSYLGSRTYPFHVTALPNANS